MEVCTGTEADVVGDGAAVGGGVEEGDGGGASVGVVGGGALTSGDASGVGVSDSPGDDT